MLTGTDSVDFVEELRLRRWARENYCYSEARQPSWHPIIHDEMRQCDADGIEVEETLTLDDVEEPTDSTILTDLPASRGDSLVPLPPTVVNVHGPHEINPPHQRVASSVDTPEMHYS